MCFTRSTRLCTKYNMCNTNLVRLLQPLSRSFGNNNPTPDACVYLYMFNILYNIGIYTKCGMSGVCVHVIFRIFIICLVSFCFVFFFPIFLVFILFELVRQKTTNGTCTTQTPPVFLFGFFYFSPPGVDARCIRV